MQKYYIERLLLVYINVIQKARVYEAKELEVSQSREFVEQQLQEDNNRSYSHKHSSKLAKEHLPRSLATILKEDNWISTLNHPPQSPDLNPIEGIQCILK